MSPWKKRKKHCRVEIVHHCCECPLLLWLRCRLNLSWIQKVEMLVLDLSRYVLFFTVQLLTKFWDTPHWWVLFHCSPAWLGPTSWLLLVDSEDSSYLPSGWCGQEPNCSSLCQSGAARPVRCEGPGLEGVFLTGVAQKHIPIRTYLSAALVFSCSSKVRPGFSLLWGPCWGKANSCLFTVQIPNISPGCQHLISIIFNPLFVKCVIFKC